MPGNRARHLTGAMCKGDMSFQATCTGSLASQVQCFGSEPGHAGKPGIPGYALYTDEGSQLTPAWSMAYIDIAPANDVLVRLCFPASRTSDKG